MDHEHQLHHDRNKSDRGFLRSRTFFVLIVFLAIAVVLMWQEHQAHILGSGLLLLLLACPLMHLFMHGGHGGNSGHAHNKENRTDETAPPNSHGEINHD